MVQKTGAELIVYALEQVGVKFTFGIPGVHNTEIYDELNKSEKITPILVTHEMSGAFAADAVSRTSDSIGCMVIVPAAGATHAMSGIGEAFLDGIPMLVISGGTRRDSGRHYQLHQIDQKKLLSGITKGVYVIENHAEIIPTIFKAYDLATQGTPGPVFVELPAELQLFRGEVSEPLPVAKKQACELSPEVQSDIILAAKALAAAQRPGLYLGWGARAATAEAIEIAERLQSPVATTLQGLSVFPGDHPLSVGMGFGAFAVPAAEKAFADCDLLFAVGARFSELATGSYSLPVPKRLIHADINPEVFNKNYPAELTLAGDAKLILRALATELAKIKTMPRKGAEELRVQIAKEKFLYQTSWTKSENSVKVNPCKLFSELRKRLGRADIMTVDDGNHTFLAEEHFPVYESGCFISPTDFNAMGYAVPAAIGAKLVNPTKKVVSIVGDGAFLMSGMETLTAASLGLGIVYLVFHDGELAQISQIQKIPLNRKTCTVLMDYDIGGIAKACGANYFRMENDVAIAPVLGQAFLDAAENKTVIIDVNIDYDRKTRFTQGVVKANLNRFPLKDKVRFVSRALKRHLLG